MTREIEARPPGSEAERRAALDVAAALRAAGRQADVEPALCWPRADLTYALHAAVAVVGSVVATSAPTVGGAIVLAALVATFLDARGILTTRRLLGRRATQNVVSPPGRAGVPAPGRAHAMPAATEDHEATVVVVAHLDTPRGGLGLGRRWRLPVLLAAMAAVFGCCVVRVGADPDSTAFTALQFALTVLVIAAGALHLDAAMAPARRQDLVGAEHAVDLAREHPEAAVLIAGAETCGGQGARAFRRRHRGKLARNAVYVDATDADADAQLSARPA